MRRGPYPSLGSLRSGADLRLGVDYRRGLPARAGPVVDGRLRPAIPSPCVRLLALLAPRRGSSRRGAVRPAPPRPAGRTPTRSYLLNVLPSPDDLRGPAGDDGRPGTLLETPSPATADPDLAGSIRRPRPEDRRRAHLDRARRRQTLQAAVSVWHSHLVATGVGADARPGWPTRTAASAWTPSDVPRQPGRADRRGPTRSCRLAYAVGPNSLYVRSTGDVPEDAVIRTLHRLIVTQEGRQAEAGPAGRGSGSQVPPAHQHQRGGGRDRGEAGERQHVARAEGAGARGPRAGRGSGRSTAARAARRPTRPGRGSRWRRRPAGSRWPSPTARPPVRTIEATSSVTPPTARKQREPAQQAPGPAGPGRPARGRPP